LPIASGCVLWCCQCGWTESALNRAAVSVTKWSDPVRISCRPRRRALVVSTPENLHFFASVSTVIHLYFLYINYDIHRIANRHHNLYASKFDRISVCLRFGSYCTILYLFLSLSYLPSFTLLTSYHFSMKHYIRLLESVLYLTWVIDKIGIYTLWLLQ